MEFGIIIGVYIYTSNMNVDIEDMHLCTIHTIDIRYGYIMLYIYIYISYHIHDALDENGLPITANL